ncbi:MAG TPA: site-2 protease family protein, partial [bacterium]|nr:site-2 protease family protein [bacterium]
MLEPILQLLSNAGYWLQVILAFSLLVVAHEFGHFIVAKWTGCRVDEFAVGFGPAIWSCKPKNSETLYALRWIPLGGYNRIWGYEDTSTEDFMNAPEEMKRRAFINRPIWARALVLIAGSAFNFILAILLVGGWGMVVGFPYTEIGEVVPGSPAEAVGIKPGDTVRNFGFASRPEDISAFIGRQMAAPFSDEDRQAFLAANPAPKLRTDLAQNPEAQATAAKVASQPYQGAPVTLDIRSGGVLTKHTMLPVTNPDTGNPMVGIVMREALGTRIDFVREDSIYARAGLQKGDTILSINGQPVESGFQIYKALEGTPETAVTVKFLRDDQEQTVTFSEFRIWNPGVMLYPAGVTAELKVAGVVPGSAADKIGIRADDIITAINGQPVNRKSANWEKMVTLP